MKRILIKEDIPEGLVASEYAGKVVTVNDNRARYAPECYVVANGESQAGGHIHEKYVEDILYIPEFEVKSGMTFETEDGARGFFLDLKGNLKMIYQTKGGIPHIHGNYSEDRLDNTVPSWAPQIDKIFEGMLASPAAIMHGYLYKDSFQGKVLWSRKPIIDPNVKLTEEYTAVVDAEAKVVKVGCQKIPFDKVLDLVAKMNEFEGK